MIVHQIRTRHFRFYMFCVSLFNDNPTAGCYVIRALDNAAVSKLGQRDDTTTISLPFTALYLLFGSGVCYVNAFWNSVCKLCQCKFLICYSVFTRVIV
jgi:hypothetical protein